MKTKPSSFRIVILLCSGWLILAGCSKQPATETASDQPTADVAEASGGSPGSNLEENPASTAPPGYPQLTVPGEDAAPNTPEAKHAAYVQQRIDELQDLATQDDPAALQTIASELSNRDPQIRAAALEAAIQSGDRSMIPRLKEAAAQTDSAEERVAIEEAIEFIQLPSLSEVMQRRRAAGITTPPTLVNPQRVPSRVVRPPQTRPRTTQ